MVNQNLQEAIKQIAEMLGVKSPSKILNMTLSDLKESFGTANMGDILEPTVRGLLLKNFSLIPGIARQIAYVDTTGKHFRTDEIWGIGDFKTLPKVEKGTPAPHDDTMTASKVEIKIDKYQSIFSVPWEDTLIDVFGVIQRSIPKLAAAARYTEEKLFWEYFLANISSCVSSGNGNITTDTISQSAVEAAREALMSQQNSQDQYLNVQGSILLGGPATDTERMHICKQQYRYGAGRFDENLLRGLYIPVTTPFITGTQWLLMASPQLIEIFVMRLLSQWGGQPVLKRKSPNTVVEEGSADTFDEADFETDSIEWKVSHAAGVKLARTDGIGIYGRIAS